MLWGRRDPLFEAIDRIIREMERMERVLFGGMPNEHFVEPLIDIFRDGQELVVVAEMPAVRKENIKVRLLDERTLFIEASAYEDKEKRLENAIHVERFYRGYRRVVELPYEVIPETARAKYKNGVLEIRIKIREDSLKKEEGYVVPISD